MRSIGIDPKTSETRHNFLVSSASRDNYSTTTSSKFDYRTAVVIPRGDYKLAYVSIPNTTYVVPTGYNTFQAYDTSLKTVTIPVGDYETADDLADAVATAMTSAMTATYTCTVSVLTKAITITASSGTFYLQLAENRFWAWRLGFNWVNGTAASSQTGTRRVNVGGYEYMGITVNNFVDWSDSGSGAVSNSGTFICPINSSIGEVDSYSCKDLPGQFICMKKDTSRFRIRLHDSFGRLADLVGSDWYMVLTKV